MCRGDFKSRESEWLGRHGVELRFGICDPKLDQWLDVCRIS